MAGEFFPYHPPRYAVFFGCVRSCACAFRHIVLRCMNNNNLYLWKCLLFFLNHRHRLPRYSMRSLKLLKLKISLLLYIV